MLSLNWGGEKNHVASCRRDCAWHDGQWRWRAPGAERHRGAHRAGRAQRGHGRARQGRRHDRRDRRRRSPRPTSSCRSFRRARRWAWPSGWRPRCARRRRSRSTSTATRSSRRPCCASRARSRRPARPSSMAASSAGRRRRAARAPSSIFPAPPRRASWNLRAYGLEPPVQAGPIGAASAMKMSYAGITKGFTALGAAMMLAATRAGTTDALHAGICRQPAGAARLADPADAADVFEGVSLGGRDGGDRRVRRRGPGRARSSTKPPRGCTNASPRTSRAERKETAGARRLLQEPTGTTP